MIGSLGLQDVAGGVTCLAQSIVNFFFIETDSSNGSWVLLDAGLPFSARQIIRAAQARFGNHPPAAILLTHGHFDHVGGLPQLAEYWNVPVYAHELELPYLTGHSSYPPPDPTVGGGGMSFLSPLYPRGPIDVGSRARTLSADFTIPQAPGWRWVPTPGHSPGHVSFFREADGVLIAGDAFVTTRQESTLGALLKRPVVWRPPAYYTCDWTAARTSIERLAALHPEIAITGHGMPMRGTDLKRGLQSLLRDWDNVIPARGRYVEHPAITDQSGIVQLPPPVFDPYYTGAVALAGVALVAGAVYAMSGEADES